MTHVESPGQSPSTTAGVGFWNPQVREQRGFVGLALVNRGSGSRDLGLAASVGIPLGPTRGSLTAGTILHSDGKILSVGGKIRVK